MAAANLCTIGRESILSELKNIRSISGSILIPPAPICSPNPRRRTILVSPPLKLWFRLIEDLDYPVLADFKKAYRERMMANGKNIDFSE